MGGPDVRSRSHRGHIRRQSDEDACGRRARPGRADEDDDRHGRPEFCDHDVPHRLAEAAGRVELDEKEGCPIPLCLLDGAEHEALARRVDRPGEADPGDPVGRSTRTDGEGDDDHEQEKSAFPHGRFRLWRHSAAVQWRRSKGEASKRFDGVSSVAAAKKVGEGRAAWEGGVPRGSGGMAAISRRDRGLRHSS